METIKGKAKEGRTVDRFDQSPQPNYPNFEPVQQGTNQKIPVGQVGWGVDKPSLASSPLGMNDHRGNHVQYWDKSREQRFINLTGEFTQHSDKKLELNPEIYHLMNASA